MREPHGVTSLAPITHTHRVVGYVGGRTRSFNHVIGETDDDLLYQDVRFVREGSFEYRFGVAGVTSLQVLLHLVAPASELDVLIDVEAEGQVVFDDLSITAEAGGPYRALVKTFSTPVTDGTLDLRFRVVQSAALVSAIEVANEPPPAERRRTRWTSSLTLGPLDRWRRSYLSDSAEQGRSLTFPASRPS
jgi:hypothetical protein